MNDAGIKMRIETEDGRSFSLAIERYEFPDEELGPTEDNPADEFDTGRFLVVAVSFRNHDGAWNASGPEMTTDELDRLAKWLDSLRSGKPISQGVYFTERNLEFSIDDKGHLRTAGTYIWQFQLPPWASNKYTECVAIEFPLDQIDIGAAVEKRFILNWKCSPVVHPLDQERERAISSDGSFERHAPVTSSRPRKSVSSRRIPCPIRRA